MSFISTNRPFDIEDSDGGGCSVVLNGGATGRQRKQGEEFEKFRAPQKYHSDRKKPFKKQWPKRDQRAINTPRSDLIQT